MLSTSITHKKENVLEVAIPLLVSLCTVAYFFSASPWKKKALVDDSTTTTITTAPPRAQVGVFETFKQLSGSTMPSFLLETARNTKSFSYRLPLEFGVGAPMVVVVGDAVTARQICNDSSTIKPIRFYQALNSLFQGVEGMYTTNGEFWHARRKGMSPAFSSKHIRRMNEVAAQKVDEWMDDRLAEFVQNGESFDVGEEMIGITLSAISETAFEYRMDDAEKKEYVHELHLALEEFIFKSIFNPLRKPFGIFFSERRRALLAAQKVTAFSMKVINNYRQLENPVKDTIIDRIMENEAYKNDLERAADITSLLIAGHDTTAFTIAWILKELSKSPKDQQELRDSLSKLQSDTWDKSPVLRNIVKEGMRLYPVGSNFTRQLKKNTATQDGYLLPKGTIAFIAPLITQRDSKVFADPDNFKPSRWVNETEEMSESFYPFALGKQNCIGQSLANAEIHNIIPRICAKYDLELVEEGTMEYFLTLQPVKTMIKATKLQ